MPSCRCVVQGCTNISNPKCGISIHSSPIENAEQCAKWKRFIRIHRSNFNPEDRFVVCSEHFEDTCFTRSLHIEGSRRVLQPGSVPTIWKKSSPSDHSASDRSRRQVSFTDVSHKYVFE